MKQWRCLQNCFGKPDIIDINFGCPVKRSGLQGAGAGVKDVDLMIR
jgi:tRNA-dihydrouridine synthase